MTNKEFFLLYNNTCSKYSSNLFWFEKNKKITYAEFDRLVKSVIINIAELYPKTLIINIKNPFYFAIAIISALCSGLKFIPVNDMLERQLIQMKVFDTIRLVDEDVKKYTSVLKYDNEVISDYCKIGRNEIALIAFSSGTTSLPHGVCLSYKNLIADVLSGLRSFKCLPETRYLHTLPYFHMFGIAVELLPVLLSGGTICNPASIYSVINEIPALKPNLSFCTVDFALVMLSYLKKCKDPSQITKYLSILVCGGSRLDSRISIELQKYGVLAIGAYGMTECSPGISINSQSDYRLGSVGKTIDCCSVEVGENSEILVKGENVATCYLDGTPLLDSRGWFHTKDLGYFDKEGYLWITGRLDDLIVLNNGKKYSRSYVESTIKVFPDVEIVSIECDRDSYIKCVLKAEIEIKRKKEISEYIYKIFEDAKVVFLH